MQPVLPLLSAYPSCTTRVLFYFTAFYFQKILDLSPIIQYTEIDYHTDNVISN